MFLAWAGPNSDPSISASQVAGITDMSNHPQLNTIFLVGLGFLNSGLYSDIFCTVLAYSDFSGMQLLSKGKFSLFFVWKLTKSHSPF
jgi:hypothetical protein